MARALTFALLIVAGLSHSSAWAQNAANTEGKRAGKKTAGQTKSTAPAQVSASRKGDVDPAPNSPAPPLSAPHTAASLTSSSAPASKAAPSEASEALTSIYRVGVGDVLNIRWRDLAPHGSTLFTVLEGGLIDFPLLGGSVAVGGLTTDEIQTRLAAEFKRRALQDSTKIRVSVRGYASHTVIITGLVVSGGTKFLRREAVPLYVILAESQSRLDAARANIMRADSPVLTIDLTDPSSSSVLVRPGDVINVTARPEQFYYIGGRINYPGQKVFQSGITLLQSILASGGLRNQSEGVVEVSRDSAGGLLATARYNLKDIKSGKVPDPRLQPGDRIEVLR